jgi:hypothetical protein
MFIWSSCRLVELEFGRVVVWSICLLVELVLVDLSVVKLSVVELMDYRNYLLDLCDSAKVVFRLVIYVFKLIFLHNYDNKELLSLTNIVRNKKVKLPKY